MNWIWAAFTLVALNAVAAEATTLKANALASLIRDPASVRTWPRRAMRGFSEAAISDAELADLIAYLRYMSARKDKP